MDSCGVACVQGYNIVAGGGLGRTHRNNDTFPRLADPIGYVDKDDLFHAIKVGYAVDGLAQLERLLTSYSHMLWFLGHGCFWLLWRG